MSRKILTYIVAFWVAVTVNWGIPRLMPGDPIKAYMAKFTGGFYSQGAWQHTYDAFKSAFGYNHPLWYQYLHYWVNIFQLNLGVSTYASTEQVTTLIKNALPWTLGLLVPAIALAYVLGNRVGAAAARRKALDNTVLPVGYTFQAMPFPWLALALAFYLGAILKWFPIGGLYSQSLIPTFSLQYIGSVLWHWFLPFLSVFLVSFGGWAIGMRNLVIYELETDYARYLRALGASERLIRRYAYRNAVLPQLSGLAIQLGVVVGGNVVVEQVFNYRGLGWLLLQAATGQDYFLLQGIFLLIVVGVLLANFLVDIIYVIVDPRTRLSMQGAQA